ncbi:MAG: site-specific DNA-methyltransferase [Polyangiaceae bacterium]|nr:site-specific DNA-methyltransferase [Polyangiaceae bacterium]
MPKSLGVSKAIDKAAGATRPVVGTRTLTGNAALSTKEKGGTYGVDVGTAPAKEVPVTAPATDEARAWDGWGTALKPASEHWILVRKPLESTVAANALKHGTGGINIDGCRIGWDPTSLAKDTARRAKPRTDIRGGSIHAGGGKPGGFIGDAESPKGRWPSNFSLEHHHDCELVGMKKVRGSNLAGPAPKAGPAWFDGAGFEHQAGAARARGQELAPDGFETVENWKCVEGCPVRTLDEQSGERPGMSGGGKHRSDYDGGLFGGIDSTTTARGDTGGASRFFYCGKATRAERGDDNDHPTVKPIELVRYLIRLVTPPGGTVLDIFMGSGTTGIAAVAEGVSFIGIDDQEKNVAIARSRLIADSPLFAAAGGVR